MSLSDERQELKRFIGDFISDTLLPGQVAQRVAESLDSKLDPEIMAQAIEGAKAKVRLIIEHIPHLTSQAFMLRIPGPEFLDFVLFSEYILLNSVQGERGALRYAKKARERTGQTLARCLNGLGFFSPQDLEPYRRNVLGGRHGGQPLWDRMIQSLTNYPKEKEVGTPVGRNQAGEAGNAAPGHGQDSGAPAAGGQGRAPRGLAVAGT